MRILHASTAQPETQSLPGCGGCQMRGGVDERLQGQAACMAFLGQRPVQEDDASGREARSYERIGLEGGEDVGV